MAEVSRSPVQVQIQASDSNMMYQMAYMSDVQYIHDEMYAQQGLYEAHYL